MKASQIRMVTAVAIACALVLGGAWAAQATNGDTKVYSISPRDDLLRTIDPADATTTSTVAITLAGKTVLGGTGLAFHSITGQLWALLRLDGQAGRELVTIDPDTGVATSIGDTGGAFAGLAFSPGGVLYGVTGEQSTGGLDPETLFTLSTTTAAPTAVCSVDATVTGGQAIAFGPGGFLFHAAGIGDTVFGPVDTSAACATVGTAIGDALKAKEVSALGFWAAEGAFLWAQGTSTELGPGKAPALQKVSPGGASALVGALDHVSKGLAILSPIPVLDHFTCYTVQPLATLTPQTVTLTDQFREAMFTAGKALHLCNPTNKNGENPGAETHPDHLSTYSIAQSFPPKFPGVNGLVITNQFGTLFIDALTPAGLMVPTSKSLIEPPPPLDPVEVDHFVCYTVKTTVGKPPFVKINDLPILDQFGSRTVDLVKPSRLCNPADKNGEDPGAESHVNHLMCYQTLDVKPAFSAVSPIYINNQFGPQELKAIILSELCVPSFKGGTPP